MHTWNCAAWAEIYSATDHRNVLMPLEILFLCLCKVSDSGTMLQHLVGNSEMASQKSDISLSHQRPTTCRAWDISCKALEVSLGFSQKSKGFFLPPRSWELLPLTDVCWDAMSTKPPPCPAAHHSRAYLYTKSDVCAAKSSSQMDCSEIGSVTSIFIKYLMAWKLCGLGGTGYTTMMFWVFVCSFDKRINDVL